MTIRSRASAVRLSTVLSALLVPAVALGALGGSALACGGLFQVANGTVGINAQRAFFSLHDNLTEMVVQISVPASPNGYGVVLPVPAEPTLDANPVDASVLDELEQTTRPHVLLAASTGGGGCGCGADGATGGNGIDGVIIGQVVNIGPVTAVSLSGTDGTALTGWLNANGYAVPPAAQQIINGYVAPGRWLVAFKRNDTATGASSVGVHLTLPGDRRGFAMRMAAIGAASEVAITVWVVAPVSVGPDNPYLGLTLRDLDPTTLRAGDYRGAVRAAVAGHSYRAWIVETVSDAGQTLPVKLLPFAAMGAKVTRLSTILPSAQLTEDAGFTAAAPANVINSITLVASVRRRDGGFGGALPVAFALAFTARRRRPRGP